MASVATKGAKSTGSAQRGHTSKRTERKREREKGRRTLHKKLISGVVAHALRSILSGISYLQSASRSKQEQNG